jgi:hypothetical protein
MNHDDLTVRSLNEEKREGRERERERKDFPLAICHDTACFLLVTLLSALPLMTSERARGIYADFMLIKLRK